MHNRITLILGAGASIPYIRAANEHGNQETLATEFLTKVLFEEHRWDSILNAYHGQSIHRTPPEDVAQAGEVVQLIRWIRERLGEGARKWTPHFENIIHVLDRVGGYLGSDSMTNYNHIDEILIDVGRFLASRNSHSWCGDGEDWVRVPALAREVLATAIAQLWSDCDRDNALRANQSFFWGLTDSADVSIYSLNYDPLLLESLEEGSCFCTGFAEDGLFDPEGVRFFDATHVLGFLHGHIGLVKHGERTRLARDYTQAQSDRLRNNSFVEAGEKGRHYNSFLITGLDKIGGFNHDPFGTYLHRFALDLRESREVIMVGYSFADHHLNAFLANALPLGVKRIIYVTLMEPCELYEAYVPWFGNKLLELASSFHDSLSDIPDELLAKQLVSSCCASGYGRLTDHVWLYIKGTDEFFKQEYPFGPC